MSMMLECNLKLWWSAFVCKCHQIKRTRESSHSTRRCVVAQGLHIAIVLGICGLECISILLLCVSFSVAEISSFFNASLKNRN